MQLVTATNYRDTSVNRGISYYYEVVSVDKTRQREREGEDGLGAGAEDAVRKVTRYRTSVSEPRSGMSDDLAELLGSDDEAS